MCVEKLLSVTINNGLCSTLLVLLVITDVLALKYLKDISQQRLNKIWNTTLGSMNQHVHQSIRSGKTYYMIKSWIDANLVHQSSHAISSTTAIMEPSIDYANRKSEN